MIHWVFEDTRHAYPVELLEGAHNIHFSDGNMKLKQECENVRKNNPEAIIIALMDAVPDNEILPSIFRGLHKEYLATGGKTIPFPIICSEYYFIQSVPDFLCTQTRPTAYKKLPTYTRRGVTSYEKYCKWWCENFLKDCASAATNEPVYVYGQCAETMNCIKPCTLDMNRVSFVTKYPISYKLEAIKSLDFCINFANIMIRLHNDWCTLTGHKRNQFGFLDKTVIHK